ncbi:hypothetical protein JB92DRAFT_2962687 [Gautieria morchelliformis]|nr:hypothetical protein JB92DRAFT_2962687 [Gautieria morchelliformis]
MNKLKQRSAFKFSNDNEVHEDTQVLDEQEQEEVIEALRSEHASSSRHYYKFLQGCLSFTILLQCWFFVSPRLGTPVHVFIPNVKTPLPNLIPFATWFTLLNIIMLLNLMLHLPKDMSFPRLLHSILSSLMSWLPLHIQELAGRHVPFPITWTAGLFISPAIIAMFTVTDIPQILWWSLPNIVLGIVVLVTSWIKQTSLDMERLEKMKYEAKGA